MSAALVVIGYAAALAWCLPRPLMHLTRSGASARLGVAAWVAAMTGVLACAVNAVERLVRAAVLGWPGLAEAVCRSVAGRACAAAVYRSAAFEVVLGVAAVIAAAGSAAAAWRYGRRVQRTQRHTRAHARAARITGRRLPGMAASTAVVLDDPQLAAYCMPGRPDTIVLTTGALAVLDPAQLTAVIAHEKAHLAGRHHLLLTLTKALAAAFPGVPVFAQGPVEVARLAEWCADDAAARLSGRSTLLAALLAMGTGQAVPAAALAVTAGSVTARVERLLEPPRNACRARTAAALIALMVPLIVVTSLVVAFAGPIAGYVTALG